MRRLSSVLRISIQEREILPDEQTMDFAATAYGSHHAWEKSVMNGYYRQRLIEQKRVWSVCGALLLLAACGSGGNMPNSTPSSSPISAASGAAADRGLSGVLHGGQAPITGSTLTLYAAGVPASAVPTILDTVTTDTSGNFSFKYTCPNEGALVYVIASGGSAGGGSNPAIELMAALGPCDSLPSFIVVNELTTVAAVYALNGFSSVNGTGGALSGCVDCVAGLDGDMTQLHGNSPAIGNAFDTAALLVEAANGEPAAFLPSAESCASGSPPINCSALGRLTALGNSLAACVNSAGGSVQCTDLFTYTNSANTLQATLFTVRNPGLVNIAEIYSLSTRNPVFTPGLSAAPTDWTIALRFNGGGILNPTAIAMDAGGNAWVTNSGNSSVSKFSPTGTALSPVSGFTGGGLSSPRGIAIDQRGHVWVANPGNNSVTELSGAGTALSPDEGFIGGGLSSPYAIAIDQRGNVWAPNFKSNSVSELSPSGAALSPATGFTGGGLSEPTSIAIDADNNVWVPNSGPISGPDANTVTELSASGAPLSPAGGFPLSNSFTSSLDLSIAVDAHGNLWLSDGITENGGVEEMSAAGVNLSPYGGFSGGGTLEPKSVAIDGNGNVWVANSGNDSVSEFSASGAPLSPAPPPSYLGGFTGGGIHQPQSLAIDAAGDVWITNIWGVTEIIGSAGPVVTPLVEQLN
jgi:DNA-binding beta-propeller fold protein YncE